MLTNCINVMWILDDDAVVNRNDLTQECQLPVRPSYIPQV